MQNPDMQVQKSPLDFIAEAYWDDFMANRPIDGGVIHEQALRACQLDGSMASLQRLDALLEQVSVQNTLRPDLFMQESRSRNFALFIGFYMGKVLTNGLQKQSEWVGQAELMRRYPDLGIHPNNPFHFMALHYETDAKTDAATEAQFSPSLFFVLEPIAIKIFGTKLKMPAVVGERIAPSLYQAVVERLPQHKQLTVANQPSNQSPNKRPTNKPTLNQPTVNAVSTSPTVETSVHKAQNNPVYNNNPQSNSTVYASANQSLNRQDKANANSASDSSALQSTSSIQDRQNIAPSQPVNCHPNRNEVINIVPATPKIVVDPALEIVKTQKSEISANSIANAKNTLVTSTSNKVSKTQGTIAQKPNPVSMPQTASNKTLTTAAKPKEAVRQDDFKDLRAELDNIDVEQKDSIVRNIHEAYRKATKVLKQVDKLIAESKSQETLASDVELPKKVTDVRQKALIMVKKSADAGHTGAMLRLAIYLFLGEGVKKNEKSGFKLIEKAANQGDIRGQRQLSRLYYQGMGCEQNMELGKYWLKKAAENGHEEAVQLLQSWQMAQTLIDEKKNDEATSRKYIILLAIVGFVGLFVVLLISIMQ